jgi:linoleoyl-CoA desaturase
MEKPSYLKDSEDARLFNELRKKVNQRVEAISENRDIYIQIKAIILPLIYLGLYFFACLMLRNIGLIY